MRILLVIKKMECLKDHLSNADIPICNINNAEQSKQHHSKLCLFSKSSHVSWLIKMELYRVFWTGIDFSNGFSLSSEKFHIYYSDSDGWATCIWSRSYGYCKKEKKVEIVFIDLNHIAFTDFQRKMNFPDSST